MHSMKMAGPGHVSREKAPRRPQRFYSWAAGGPGHYPPTWWARHLLLRGFRFGLASGKANGERGFGSTVVAVCIEKTRARSQRQGGRERGAKQASMHSSSAKRRGCLATTPTPMERKGKERKGVERATGPGTTGRGDAGRDHARSQASHMARGVADLAAGPPARRANK